MIVGSLVVVFGQHGKVAEPRPRWRGCQVVTGTRVVLTSCHGKGAPPLCSATTTSLRASGPYLIMASAGCSGQGPKVCGATMVFRGTTEDDRKEVARLRDHTHLRLSRATPPAEWYDGAMIAIIPIEPISEAHAFLIVDAFNRFFIDRGGLWDAETCGWGGGDGDGDGDGFDEYYGDGKGGGSGIRKTGGQFIGDGDGSGDGDGEPAPEEWRVQ